MGRGERNSRWRLALSFSGSAPLPMENFAMPHVENDRIVEHADEARAGVTGHNVRYVLLIGTLAVIVLFAMAYVATRW